MFIYLGVLVPFPYMYISLKKYFMHSVFLASLQMCKLLWNLFFRWTVSHSFFCDLILYSCIYLVCNLILLWSYFLVISFLISLVLFFQIPHSDQPVDWPPWRLQWSYEQCLIIHVRPIDFKSHWTLSVNSIVQGPHFVYHNLYIK